MVDEYAMVWLMEVNKPETDWSTRCCRCLDEETNEDSPGLFLLDFH